MILDSSYLTKQMELESELKHIICAYWQNNPILGWEENIMEN